MKKRNTTTRLTATAVLAALAVFGGNAAHGSGVLMQLYFDGTNTCTYLSGTSYSLSALSEKLTATSTAIPGSVGMRIPVKVCPDVPFKDVVAVVGVVQNAGFTNVVVDLRKPGADLSPSSVRLFLGRPPQYKIIYDGSTLQAVPVEE